MSKPRLISFYLPQFHPTPENDEWWGKGFTEWTNVGRAKPLFRGHYQPRIPADLGYYDLRLPIVREQQAQMAADAGIEGFCYWHYWFNGKRMLDRVFTEVLESGSPNFPFCLCWANHSWYAKKWDPSQKDRLLIEQTYPGEQDYIDHFYALLPAFKDSRYIKVNGKNLFAIFAPSDVPDTKLFMNTWNKLAKDNGIAEFYFLGFYRYMADALSSEFDGGIVDFLWKSVVSKDPMLIQYWKRLRRQLFHYPARMIDYQDYVDCLLEEFKPIDHIYPSIVPNFDHSPRSAYMAPILNNSTPEKWGRLLRGVSQIIKDREDNNNLVFIKAWNEWGEGNYLEPDLKYGKGYLDQIKKSMNL